MAIATYCIRRNADAKYVTRGILWDGVAPNVIPAAHTGVLATPAVLAQANADMAAVEAQAAADAAAGLRDRARNYLVSDPEPEMKALRALALVVLDENNLMRDWIQAFVAAVAASTSLANMQTRVAALQAMPDRTSPQLVNAMVAKIADGSAD
jgi:hypothetical protein